MPAWVMLGLGIASFAGACVLRLRWPGWSEPRQRWTLWMTLVPTMVLLLSLLTGWRIIHPVVRQVWELVALCAYSFLALLVSLRKPRGLSALGSALLLLPALVFLVLTPLKPLVEQQGRVDEVSAELVIRRVPARPPQLHLLRRVAWLPGLEQDQGRVDIDTPCDVMAGRVTLDPGGKLVRIECPLPGGKMQEYRVRLR